MSRDAGLDEKVAALEAYQACMARWQRWQRLRRELQLSGIVLIGLVVGGLVAGWASVAEAAAVTNFIVQVVALWAVRRQAMWRQRGQRALMLEGPA
jgi:hypothetical protein